jgi:acetyl esterase/lipase
MIQRLVGSLIVRAVARQNLQPGASIARQRWVADTFGRLAWAPQAEVDPDRHVLYLHGGAFVAGSPVTYRSFTRRLGRESGAAVHVPDYRRAPEHPYPAALDDVHAAYLELLEAGHDPRRIALAGDSAGGQLCLALALRLRERGEPLPAGIALVSPWTDLTLSDPRVTAATNDAFLRPAWLVQGAELYARDHDRTIPELSPLLADLSGLPPMLVHVGSTEPLLVDSERLAERVTEAGGAVELKVFEGYWHDLHLLAGIIPVATQATAELGAFLREVTAGARPAAT